MRLFLDTNVLIDYFAQRQPFFEPIAKIRVAQVFGDVELWASVQSFPDIEHVLRKAIPVPKLRRMLKESLAFINIATPSASDLAEGVESGWPDLEDFVIAASASRVQADYLISRDRGGFKKCGVETLTPAEWVALMEGKGVTYAEVDLD